MCRRATHCSEELVHERCTHTPLESSANLWITAEGWATSVSPSVLYCWMEKEDGGGDLDQEMKRKERSKEQRRDESVERNRRMEQGT